MRPLPGLLLVAASAASAQGLDRDTLLTDAPAVPPVGTVRVAGAGVATEKSDSSSSSFTGTVGWTPIQNLHGDVGAYFQSGAQGPAARIRYQLFNQRSHGLDLATGGGSGEAGGGIGTLLLLNLFRDRLNMPASNGDKVTTR